MADTSKIVTFVAKFQQMKKKVYFRYNTQTKSYERVHPSLKSRLFAVLRHLAVGILLGYAFFWIVIRYYGSPNEQSLRKENELMVTQYELLSKRLDEITQVVDEIAQRDDNMYRAVLHSKPIPSGIRNANKRSSRRYQHLKDLSTSEIVIRTSAKMDVLSQKLYIQSTSFNEIVKLIGKQKDRVECIPSIQPVADKELKRMASGYGMRIDPVYGGKRFHSGMDFTADIGTPVYATGKGKVVEADWKQGYGMCVVIDHGYGYRTLYAHLSEYVVKVGDVVKRGQEIAKVGNTGKSTGPHLHYEVHVNGQPDNPAKYYFMDLTPEEYDRILKEAENRGNVMD